MNGGGILVLIRSEYEYCSTYLTNIEAIHFRIKIVDSYYYFISAYKPPSLNDALFLDHLSTKTRLRRNLFLGDAFGV